MNYKNKVVCVTGGLGTIGQEIVEELIRLKTKKIIIFDNRETELFYSKKEHPNVIHKFVDIREKINLKGIDIVFHTAAMKHVGICEENPFEAIKTNVLGTSNIINACIKNKVKKMILISTDKAVDPIGVMGATKLLAEKLVSATAINGKLDFGVVRFGNVINSRGSVIEIWNKQLEEKKKVILTEGEMTRYFMTKKGCIKLIFTATEIAKFGEVFIPKIKSIKMKDLLDGFLVLKGASKDIKTIGIQKGEKMHEKLLSDEDNDIILQNNKIYIKLPYHITKNRIKELNKKGFK